MDRNTLELPLQKAFNRSDAQEVRTIDLQSPFKSFWMAGFECTDKLNAFGERVYLLNTTGHLALIDDDYQRLSVFGIRTVREGLRWSQVEKIPYQYDWTRVA